MPVKKTVSKSVSKKSNTVKKTSSKTAKVVEAKNKTLIIVESPTKARTFTRILAEKGDQYTIVASVGHFRDLPANNINIDIDHDFKPRYAIDPKKEKVVAKLTELGSSHGEVILATDEDREGEAIAYHLAYILGFVDEKWPSMTLRSNLKRIVFHEITQKAINEALANPESLRLDLVKSQQARRILDRLVGYKISPVLWEKLGKNWLSAGRVQTVGLRLIVEREKEILAFEKRPYYKFEADLIVDEHQLIACEALLYNGQKIALSSALELFEGPYNYESSIFGPENYQNALDDLLSQKFTVTQVTEEEGERFPPPPFTTSSLQIEAYRQLGFPAKFTMKIAQSLYEKGLITYHRTDSFNLSAGFVFGAKDFITEKFGAEYALEKPRGYRTKTRGAQQAHEAIRPTKVTRHVDELKTDGKVTGDTLKLYELIYRRALATQMQSEKHTTQKITLSSTEGSEFEAKRVRIDFLGFQILYHDKKSAPKSQEFFALKVGQVAKIEDLRATESQTRPPWRYNDGSLVKALEERGIGRPSTYASILTHIIDKQYVVRERGNFVPTPLGTTVSDYLSSHFDQYFELDFTSQMEERLDKIASGEEDLLSVIHMFYDPLALRITSNMADKEKIVVKDELLDEKCELCGAPLTIRFGRYGKFMPCSRYPECKFIKKNLKYVEGHMCPKDGGRLVVRFAPRLRRRFFGCENYPKCDYSTFVLGQDPKPKSTEAKEPKKARKKKVVKKKTVKK